MANFFAGYKLNPFCLKNRSFLKLFLKMFHMKHFYCQQEKIVSRETFIVLMFHVKQKKKPVMTSFFSNYPFNLTDFNGKTMILSRFSPFLRRQRGTFLPKTLSKSQFRLQSIPKRQLNCVP